jgi:hypothetical protein
VDARARGIEPGHRERRVEPVSLDARSLGGRPPRNGEDVACHPRALGLQRERSGVARRCHPLAQDRIDAVPHQVVEARGRAAGAPAHQLRVRPVLPGAGAELIGARGLAEGVARGAKRRLGAEVRRLRPLGVGNRGG